MNARVPACLAALALAVAAEPVVITPHAWSVVGAYASATASDLDRGFTRTVAVGRSGCRGVRRPAAATTQSGLRRVC